MNNEDIATTICHANIITLVEFGVLAGYSIILVKQYMIKAFTKKIFNFFGYNIVKFDRNFYGLKHENFDLIIDVGASVGNTSKFFLNTFPYAKIYAFEPNPSNREDLKKIKKKFKNRFTSVLKGVGARNGFLELNINKLHHPSSSFLKLSKIGTKEGSEFTKVDLSVQKKIRTPIVTLDNYFKNFNLKNKKILLKSDTQGFEVEVLKGAKNLLKAINTAIVEANFTDDYEKQCNPIDIITHLKLLNFELKGFTYPPGINDKGEILGTDFIFKKKN